MWGGLFKCSSLPEAQTGLAEICEEDAKKVLIPLLSEEVREQLVEYVDNLKSGTMTINARVKQMIKDNEVSYNDPERRPSHIVLV